ncbi:helix-turn-helix domain-containing protein [Algoriphagus aquatilis]|uniref:Helix-turn-helix domain-containing protein n=1 Tax=Algoriphagus aquatilis TaxID=490186 RepID=A0ABW0BYF9_9BACT
MTDKILEGKFLKDFIKSNKFSIKTLSEKMGVSRQTIYNWYNEEILGIELIEKLNDAIGHDFLKELKKLKNQEPPKKRNSLLGITIFLDGSPEKLENGIKELIAFNEKLKK